MSFLLFDQGKEPDSVSFAIGIHPDTARRYYSDWKKLPPNYNQAYLLVRQTMRRMTPKEKTIVWEALADELDCEVSEIEVRMSHPWALRDLVTQRWRQWNVSVTKRKREGQPLTRVLNKVIHHSEDAEYVLAIVTVNQPEKSNAKK